MFFLLSHNKIYIFFVQFSVGSFTLRDLFRWGNRYTFADKKLLPNTAYDWNQHLVDEGYLTLSAKIRSESEVEAIETALFNNFRKKIDLTQLFDLTERTSMVTRSILKAVEQHPNFENIVWTGNMRRMAVLTAKALEFNEPVLLVGPTGCGKTTICQILADIASTRLRILNCHMHTEGADFLGGLRPYRGGDGNELRSCADDEPKSRQLFEWANGPLILSMLEGTYFLADEISLAEDSVLERLNCILEPERTVLLAEKGGCNESFLSETSSDRVRNEEFIIVAAKEFQFLATMNPGGDFGKKELSPALRNRFTEIWCRPTDGREDLIRIAAHTLRTGFVADAAAETRIQDIATIVVDTVFYLKNTVAKFSFSIRDVLAWIGYIVQNAHIAHNEKALTISEALVFGLETIFLDSLEMLPHDSYAEIERIRAATLRFLVADVRAKLQMQIQLDTVLQRKGTAVLSTDNRFGIEPFFVDRNCATVSGKSSDFFFTAPTTQRNLFRLLSALSLHKSILLEGPPGVGKTSLIENLTAAIGYRIVRINLCEHTDLADLFGTDLPAADDEDDAHGSEPKKLGSFVWRDGPLLAALKAPHTWILLDELNLAPQSVLEGLNAVLDHRGEVYIPELNKTFKLGRATRIFASQNPLKQGGGRKGLPQSFLNRFTKVYLRKLDTVDLEHVVNGKYGAFFERLAQYFGASYGGASSDDTFQSFFDGSGENIKFDLCQRMVAFSERLDAGIANFEFGYKGGPFEVNLRDILRWCDFLSNSQHGFSMAMPSPTLQENNRSKFLLILYEKMKLVYYQRMRADADKSYIRQVFSDAFGGCDAEQLEQQSQDISLYWTADAMYLGDIRLAHQSGDANGSAAQDLVVPRSKMSTPLVLTSQMEMLKNLAECLLTEKPVILCGPTDW